jgi:hypothetical protein
MVRMKEAEAAALVAITAARKDSQTRDNPGAVLPYLKDVNGKAAVDGVSGKINLDRNTGNPINRAMPLLQIDNSGHQTLIGMRRPLGKESTGC